MHALMAATAEAIAQHRGKPERLAGWTRHRGRGASAGLLRTQTDERLMAPAAGGCDAAFESLVRRYRGPLQRFARRFVSDALAEDVVQQAFVELWTKLGEGYDIYNLQAWLFRVARNGALNCIRRDAKQCEEPHDRAGGEPADVVYERTSHLRQALHAVVALPNRQREVLMHTIDGSSRAQIAVAMGITDAAAGQMLHRARASLRSAVSALVPWPLVNWAIGLRRHGARAANIAQVATVEGARAPMLARCGAALVLIATGGVAPLAIIHAQRSQSAARAHNAIHPARVTAPATAASLPLVELPGAMQAGVRSHAPAAPAQPASVTPPPAEAAGATAPESASTTQPEPAPDSGAEASASSPPADGAAPTEAGAEPATAASADRQPGQTTEPSSESPAPETATEAPASEAPAAEATPPGTRATEAPAAETTPVEATPPPAGL
jgi:RNA polymerase sigma factor (sigma-70 family)